MSTQELALSVATWNAALERIEAEARELTPKRVLLTLLAGIPWVLAFLAARVCAVAWVALTWAWCALVVGWRAGAGPAGVRKRYAPPEGGGG
jgi:hypothetical protein